MSRTALLIILAAASAACHNTPEPPPYGVPAPPAAICTMEARPAITVQAVDAGTGRTVTGAITVIVQDGTFADTAQARPVRSGPQMVPLAFERAGTYTVIVRHPSYREWRRTGVEVRRDECHVRTVELRAELRP